MVKRARRRPSRQEASALMRRRLIDTAKELAREEPVALGIDQVRVTEVADRAAVTTGALYHYWESQEEYRQDLLHEILTDFRFPQDAQTRELAKQLHDQGMPSSDLIRLSASLTGSKGLSAPETSFFMGMWAEGSGRLHEKVVGNYRAVAEAWTDVVSEVFDLYGLEPRPPLTVQDVAVAVSSVVEGVTARERVAGRTAPEEVSDDQGQAWTTGAMLVLSFVSAFTRQRGSDDQADLFEYFNGYFGSEH